MILTIPAIEETPWPTLGPGIVKWCEKNLVFGPGDLRGEPLRLTASKKMLIYRMYEVFPQGHRLAGRRRFRRCAISVRKGRAKSELLAVVAAAELSTTAPVRCIGWDKKGRPIGGPVKEVYIPLVATTQEQTEDLAYYALKVILELSPIAKQFDIQLSRIMRKDGSGKAVALASSPDARDGARTSFAGIDESHRWTAPRLKAAYTTMLANLPKRKLADPWSLEVTTAPAPGEDSVAERTMDYAQAVYDGRKTDSDLFFFHEQATQGEVPALGRPYDLSKEDDVRMAVIEASGADDEWSDIDGICAQFKDPTADVPYLCRVWLNQLIKPLAKAFDAQVWDRRAKPNYKIPEGALVSLGFDGALTEDGSALVATELRTGFQEKIGLWEKPFGSTNWRINESDVDSKVSFAFEYFNVWKMYADPYFWENWVATWTGRYGHVIVRGPDGSESSQPRVLAFHTNIRGYKMPMAVRAFYHAMQDEPPTDLAIPGEPRPESDGEDPKPQIDVLRLSHGGDPDIRRHIANANRQYMTLRDANGEFLWVICKEAPNSPLKIDAAMASILSWEARRDAVAAGVVVPEIEQDYRVEWFV